MKKIFYLLVFAFILSCTPKIVVGSKTKGDTMYREMNGNYSMGQLDSMCVADTLPKDMTKWEIFTNRDYETNEVIILYLYMKQNGKTESVYKVERLSDDSVKIIKRVISE